MQRSSSTPQMSGAHFFFKLRVWRETSHPNRNSLHLFTMTASVGRFAASECSGFAPTSQRFRLDRSARAFATYGLVRLRIAPADGSHALHMRGNSFRNLRHRKGACVSARSHVGLNTTVTTGRPPKLCWVTTQRIALLQRARRAPAALKQATIRFAANGPAIAYPTGPDPMSILPDTLLLET